MLARHYLNQRVLVRTYSAGVHTGTLTDASDDGLQVRLIDGRRIWSWQGSLSLSGVAANGITGGKVQATPEVYLTNVIEVHPVTPQAWESYGRYLQ